jgi:hypothetical protein
VTSPVPAKSSRFRRLAVNPESAIYGTVVTAAIMAAEGDSEHATISVVAAILATVIVFGLAHAYSNLLGRAVTHKQPTLRGFGVVVRQEWPLVEASFLPIVALIGSRLVGLSRSTAILVGLIVCVVELAGWAVLVCRRLELTGMARARVVVQTSLFGLVIIALKVAVH